jgi:PAS domain S-box-containing protein
VRAFGEMVSLLAAQGCGEAALQVEQLWTALAKRIPFSLHCAYQMDSFSSDRAGDLFSRVCAEHSGVTPAESYSELATRAERMRSIAGLQHKAKVLPLETAQRRQAEKSLHLREKELADFVENAVEGLHQLGPDGAILWANPAQLKLLGYSAEEYIGHKLAEFHVDPNSFDEFWQKIMRREPVYDYPSRLRCNDGSIKHVVTHSSGYWEDGKFLYTRCFIRDVTDRVQLEEELEKTVEQLAEADRRKDEFLAMLGHELRNPLAAVSNAIATARFDPSRSGRALEIAQRQTDQLARLVGDLLDMARITQSRIALRKKPVCLREVADRAIERMRPAIESHGHTLIISIQPEAESLEVNGDETRLQQVIDNLLHNAVKFTEPGGRIEVTMRAQGTELTLTVRDTGIGIAPAMLPRVFDLFTQGERSLDRGEGGLGIGLTLVKRLVEMHGGCVAARSDGPGTGSEFEIRLPVMPAAPHGAQSAETAFEVSGHARVLVVEDNADAAESLKMVLEMLGHEVQAVSDGAAAVDAVRDGRFDVALVDIGLPDMDGYAVARHIRRLPNANAVVLAALTGYGQKEDRQRALAAGFDHHLVKPLGFKSLEAFLGRVLDPRLGHPAS